MQLVVTLVATVLYAAFNPRHSAELAEQTISSNSIALLVASNCLCVLVFALVCRVRNSSLSEKASINAMPPRVLPQVAVLGVVSTYAVNVILSILIVAKAIPSSWVTMLEETNSDFAVASPAMLFISTVIMAPVLEEILFRGLILGTLKKTMHPWIAIVISSVIFGLAHGTPIGILYATCLGILMGWLTIKFNSILPSMVFHMAYNATVSYSEGMSVIALVACFPVMIYMIILINKNFRGDKK